VRTWSFSSRGIALVGLYFDAIRAGRRIRGRFRPLATSSRVDIVENHAQAEDVSSAQFFTQTKGRRRAGSLGGLPQTPLLLATGRRRERTYKSWLMALIPKIAPRKRRRPGTSHPRKPPSVSQRKFFSMSCFQKQSRCWASSCLSNVFPTLDRPSQLSCVLNPSVYIFQPLPSQLRFVPGQGNRLNAIHVDGRQSEGSISSGGRLW